MKKVGVLALQGAVSEHLRTLERLGVTGVAVRTAQDLQALDGLIIPGGESTAICRLIHENHMEEMIRTFAKTRSVFGTCAGLILCAGKTEPADRFVTPLGLIDITVERNGFGRQVDSFETTLDIPGIGEAIPAVFIRAPFIRETGPDVQVLATLDGKIVMAQQGRVLVTAFHPELTDDTRILAHFLKGI